MECFYDRCCKEERQYESSGEINGGRNYKSLGIVVFLESFYAVAGFDFTIWRVLAVSANHVSQTFYFVAGEELFLKTSYQKRAKKVLCKCFKGVRQGRIKIRMLSRYKRMKNVYLWLEDVIHKTPVRRRCRCKAKRHHEPFTWSELCFKCSFMCVILGG
jgi:hypothetical protein